MYKNREYYKELDCPGILYLIKIHKTVGAFAGNYFYKIGITRYDVETRYSRDLIFPYAILFEKHFDKIVDAYDLEQKYLQKFKKLIIPDCLALFENTGNTEVFGQDPFKGDYSTVPGRSYI